ncbi:hypothetical protein [Candidatus Solincola tengchongensis]|uniref:hypothetical protein n=1 Tax=Candidatus Solincola tengchongensis TaxID=2900693 RepID=UPI00257C9392|nr:hypothetical protein [Candidatus Solincola tengchongensis]
MHRDESKFFLGVFFRKLRGSRVQLPGKFAAMCDGDLLVYSVVDGPLALVPGARADSFQVECSDKAVFMGKTKIRSDNSIMLSQEMIKAGKLKCTVVICGLVNWMELWEEDDFQKAAGAAQNLAARLSEDLSNMGFD